MSEKYKNIKQYCNQKGIFPEPGYWWDFWEIIDEVDEFLRKLEDRSWYRL